MINQVIERPSFRNVFNGGQKWTCDIRRGAKPRAVCVSTQPFRGVWGHAPPEMFVICIV